MHVYVARLNHLIPARVKPRHPVSYLDFAKETSTWLETLATLFALLPRVTRDPAERVVWPMSFLLVLRFLRFRLIIALHRQETTVPAQAGLVMEESTQVASSSET